MIAPLNLDAGLHLEKSQLLLPWGSSIEQLCRVGTPEIYRYPSAINILWKNEAVLDGLLLQVNLMTASGPNVFYLSPTEQAESPQAEYAFLLKELSFRLGPPHSSIMDEIYPWSRWFWDDIGVSLRIAERFTEYVSLVVAKGIFDV